MSVMNLNPRIGLSFDGQCELLLLLPIDHAGQGTDVPLQEPVGTLAGGWQEEQLFLNLRREMI